MLSLPGETPLVVSYMSFSFLLCWPFSYMHSSHDNTLILTCYIPLVLYI